MFTFGRDHERKCAVAYVKSPQQNHLILQVVDSVHDLLENKTYIEKSKEHFRQAFINGGSGVWEQTGSWMKKLSREFPEIYQLWFEFAKHPNAKVRFGVACFINVLSEILTPEIISQLLNDKSCKVSKMAYNKLKLQE